MGGYGWTGTAEWSASPRLALDQRTYLVRRTALSDVSELGWHPRRRAFDAGAPSLLWPLDRAWFVASDPDLDSSYVGGSTALIDALLREPDLETWRVDAVDLVSIGSDEINVG